VRIGLVSDTHGSARNFRKVLDGPFKNVELILHGGDILYHGAGRALTKGYDTSGLAKMINELTVPILIAKGNCDSDVDQMVIDSPIMSPYVLLSIDEKKIMVLHGDGKTDKDLASLMARFNLTLLVHGHSHIPRIRSGSEGLIVNPGTPTIPNPSSPFNKTVGTFDTADGRVEIIDIDSMKVVLEGSL
jgi:putative phosphoesterase